MHPLLWFIVVAYLAVQGLETALTVLNRNHLARHGSGVPEGFEGSIDENLLGKMKEYTLEGSRLDLISSWFTVALTLGFIFGGVLDWYNRQIWGLQLPEVWSGVLFFLALSLAGLFLKIPFSLYSTFHIEKKYGFNTQSFGLWFADLLKGLLLSLVLNGLLLAGVFWLIGRFPGSWWLLAWLLLFIFSIFMLYVSPLLIEPLFNKFSPIADHELEREIKGLMRRAGLAVSRVFTMDASRRSTHSNAYFSGIGRVKRIVLFDTLLKGVGKEEILAILAHEAGHWRKKHLVKKLVVLEILAFLGLYLLFRAVEGDLLTDLFGIGPPTTAVKILLAGFVGSIVFYPLQPLSHFFSRRQEVEADDYAAELTGNPQALARSLVILGRDNLANLHPHPLYAVFHYSHPPLAQRVARLLRMS